MSENNPFYTEVREVIDVGEANNLARQGWHILKVVVRAVQISSADEEKVQYTERLAYVLGKPGNA